MKLTSTQSPSCSNISVSCAISLCSSEDKSSIHTRPESSANKLLIKLFTSSAVMFSILLVVGVNPFELCVEPCVARVEVRNKYACMRYYGW